MSAEFIKRTGAWCHLQRNRLLRWMLSRKTPGQSSDERLSDDDLPSNVRRIKPLHPSRPKRVIGWTMAAAAASLAVAIGLYTVVAENSEVKGRTIAAVTEQSLTRVLEDGTIVSLTPGTELQVEYSDKVRRIVLIRGRAIFAVAKNAYRPFVVTAKYFDAAAIGTKFTVDIGAGVDTTVRVEVHEGIVEVSRRGSKAGAAIKLTTGKSARCGGPMPKLQCHVTD